MGTFLYKWSKSARVVDPICLFHAITSSRSYLLLDSVDDALESLA